VWEAVERKFASCLTASPANRQEVLVHG
jgi:hypothetical protein